MPNKRVYTPYLIFVPFPPCTILFGHTRLLIFGHFSGLHEIKFITFFFRLLPFQKLQFSEINFIKNGHFLIPKQKKLFFLEIGYYLLVTKSARLF